MTAAFTPHHILITGAAGAIGSALARALRVAWPEVRLALVDRTEAPMHALEAELGGEISVHAADLADLASLPGLVAAVKAIAPLDGLVNCAGVMRVAGIGAHGWDDASQLLTIDLLAPLRLQELLAHDLVARRSGVVVNVASMAGRVPLRGCTYYGAAKAGLGMASEIARAELGEHGVRVVTVYPGPVHSALEKGARDAYGGGGLMGRLVPTGDAGELARRIVIAIQRDEARVIYPRLYGVGWSAPNFTRWVSLSYGPPPVS